MRCTGADALVLAPFAAVITYVGSGDFGFQPRSWSWRSAKAFNERRDANMLFVPNRVEIRKGEQINFVLHNTGEPDHEFVLATTQENLEHAEMMRKR